MSRKIINILIAIAAVSLIAAMAIIYHDVNPLESSKFPQCAFYKATGYLCPGCGGQRAFHYLLRGEFGESFAQNQLLWIGTLYIILLQILRIPSPSGRLGRIREHLSGAGACAAWIVAILAFGVLRNVF